MASTRFRMIGVALFVVALSAVEAIQWDGGPADKANITSCVGGIASIPWSFVKGDGETLLSLAWGFQAPGKEKTQIATSNNGHFYTTEKKKFGFLTNAGLSLHDARSQDSGDYSVQVQLLQTDSNLVTVGRMVTLSVTDTPPATQDGDLHVTLSDVVRDDVTEDWIVPLYCGHFVDLGHPPVGVVWTTPSGEVRNSSYQDKGSFVLSLSSPVQGGNYSCHLSPSAPAARCLTATSTLKAAAQLYVHDNDVRLLLLEAQLQETSSRQSKLIGDLNRTVDFMFQGLSSCKDWLARDPRSGVRAIQASGQIMAVYCDQVTDKGGWTVFQRRKDASVDFYQGWTEYRNGFGDLEGNFWLGLDKLHSLTTSQRYELRVDLYKVDWRKGYATYSGFYVDDASHNFALHFDNFTGGNAGDSLSNHRGQQFTTKDRDHDAWDSGSNCAQIYHGAWWYTCCFNSNLNGEYNPKNQHHGLTIWHSFEGGNSLKFTEMKIRPI
ncbi:tenascin-R-like [Littorina saxatilis]|uniref:Fibrinogen C-terminal domain-containing protein n=1 Tax=Littorina saxatilis TaxID=31220 RepID=A0AAN9ANY7_9CAEN